MIKRFILICASVATVFAFMAKAQETSVLTYIEGFPIPDSFVEQEDSAVMFDKMDGRIIESKLMGRGNAQELKAMYAEVLPQLGWQPVLEEGALKLVFHKEQEELTLTFHKVGSQLEVLISLRPLASE